MTDEITEPSTESNSFKKIRDYLEGGWEHREFSIGLLATAIDKDGIYTWDRFGRFGEANVAEKVNILNLLARIYEYENDSYGKQHPLDEASTLIDDPFSLFGWRTGNEPNFEKLAKQHSTESLSRPKTQEQSGITKIQNTHLLIIWALCTKLGIQYNERGAAVRIRELIEETGAKCDEGTISKVLKKLQEV